jgi:hypothetical protein
MFYKTNVVYNNKTFLSFFYENDATLCNSSVSEQISGYNKFLNELNYLDKISKTKSVSDYNSDLKIKMIAQLTEAKIKYLKYKEIECQYEKNEDKIFALWNYDNEQRDSLFKFYENDIISFNLVKIDYNDKEIKLNDKIEYIVFELLPDYDITVNIINDKSEKINKILSLCDELNIKINEIENYKKLIDPIKYTNHLGSYIIYRITNDDIDQGKISYELKINKKLILK